VSPERHVVRSCATCSNTGLSDRLLSARNSPGASPSPARGKPCLRRGVGGSAGPHFVTPRGLRRLRHGFRSSCVARLRTGRHGASFRPHLDARSDKVELSACGESRDYVLPAQEASISIIVDSPRLSPVPAACPARFCLENAPPSPPHEYVEHSLYQSADSRPTAPDQPCARTRRCRRSARD
jgi:hypothetical protein